MSFKPTNKNLSQNQDISLNQLTGGDVLSYDATHKKWQNKAVTATVAANSIGDSQVSAISETKITNLTNDLANRVQTTGGGLQTVVKASAGSTYTANLAMGNVFALTLTANCTLSISGATNGKACSITLMLIQDATGSRTVTWPSGLVWPNGTAPTLATAAGKFDLINLLSLDGGATWAAYVNGLNFAAVGTGTGGSGSGGSGGTTSNFITRSNTTLSLNGSTWRGAGVDWHWAALRESNLQYPTHAMVDEILNEVVSLGANVVRAHTLGISAGLANQLVTGMNSDGTLIWNNAAWEPIDYVISACKSRGIYLWIPFTDQFSYYHKGKGEFVKWAYQYQSQSGAPSSITLNGTTYTGITSFDPSSGTVASDQRYKAISQQFYKLPWIQNAFLAYVTGWFNHVNQYTSVANKDEPVIAFAQMGNELWDSGDQWPDHAGAAGIAAATAFSAAVKAVAPHVLVIDPLGADGVDNNYAPGRNDANTDMFDYHLYNNHQTITSGYVTGLAAKAAAFNKVQVFGEYPYTNAGIGTALSEMEETASIGFGLFWAIYSSTENHTSGGVDDTVYTVGQSNGGWKTTFQNHAAIMESGAVPPPPPPPTNIMRSASVANCEDPVSSYASGATGTSTPVLATASGQGITSGAALQATLTGSDHKWVWANLQSAAAPVITGQTYTATAFVKLVSGTPSTGVVAHLTWRDSAGNYVSGSTSASYTTLNASWQQITYTATAPASAAYAVPQIELDGPASGNAVILIDQWGIFAGASASPWSSP